VKLKIAEVKKSKLESAYPELEDISAELDKQNDRLIIDTINWDDYTYKPRVEVAIEYSDNELFLNYYICENYFKAEMIRSNQMVCEDSCVEFFVSPEEDGIYYNLEFNGIGTCLMGSGTERADRIRANPEIISKIRRITSLGHEPVEEKTGEIIWTITIAIPFEVFFRHEIKNLKGKSFKANFYKCGDKLTEPHYVTWSPVGTSRPDYHQPAYFGVLKFI
jgi:hypothetical protein